MRTDLLRCCFCGEDPDIDEYLELELNVAGNIGFQILGAHREHLAASLAPGFWIEVESAGADAARSEHSHCCFCSLSIADRDYVQIIVRSPTADFAQVLGAHREHLEEHLAASFYLELPEAEPFGGNE